MEFEFDEAKSESNQQKHGMDFVRGQTLWNDSARVEIRARSEGEARFKMIGKIQGQLWVAVITYRSKRTRIISIRKARPKERRDYEKNQR